ncbi:MAG: hypothetical protein KAH32_04600 [Chlamydiia bacterium]|nr:hypothetical protein [Chlamydiia bacterium]
MEEEEEGIKPAGAGETFKVGSKRYKDIYNTTDKGNMYNTRKGHNSATGETLDVANMGMLPEVNVFEDIGEENKWKLDYSGGKTFTDENGVSHPLTKSYGGYKINSQGEKERWFDTRNEFEKTMDYSENKLNNLLGSTLASPITGYLNMGSNASKTVSGNGTNRWTNKMSDPANSNRLKAGLTLGTDIALMAASGGIPGGSTVKRSLSSVSKPGINLSKKFIPKVVDYGKKKLGNVSYGILDKYANSGFKQGYNKLASLSNNPVGEGITDWAESKGKKFLQGNRSGNFGTIANAVAEDMADFNGGVSGTVKEIVSSSVDDTIKNPLKNMYRRGGLLYRK